MGASFQVSSVFRGGAIATITALDFSTRITNILKMNGFDFLHQDL